MRCVESTWTCTPAKCCCCCASGSGKSTLVNILGGLDTATSGEVLYRGKDLTRASDRELTEYRRHFVGFVFQFYNLIPSLTACENVSIVTEIADNPMQPEQALLLAGLKDRMVHFPAQLSGGEQQRVAIARAIAKQPAVLLCDEPAGALDSRTESGFLGATSCLSSDGWLYRNWRVVHCASDRAASFSLS